METRTPVSAVQETRTPVSPITPNQCFSRSSQSKGCVKCNDEELVLKDIKM